MQGAPPPVSQRVRFQDDRFLEHPQNRWVLSHIRELVPTATVWRGSGASSDLGAVPHDAEAAIDAMVFTDLDGASHTWPESLLRTYTDGILVLHRGVRIYERYFGALEPHRPHLCFFGNEVIRGDAGRDAAARRRAG